MAAPSLDSLNKRFTAINAEYQTAQATGAGLSPIEDKVNALFASLQGRVCLEPGIETSPEYQSLARNVLVLQEHLQSHRAPHAAVATDSAAIRTLSRTSASLNLLDSRALARLRGGSAASAPAAASDPSRRPAISCSSWSLEDDEMMPTPKRSFSSTTDTWPMFPPIMPDTRKRRVSPTSPPHLEKGPGVSVEMGMGGAPIHTYNIADKSVGYVADPTSFLDYISSLDSGSKKNLKIFLEALNQPIIPRFFILSICAEAILKMTGHNLPPSPDGSILSNVYARLSDVPSEFPAWGIPPIIGFEKLHKQIRYIIDHRPSEIAEFESSIRSLLIVAPYLVPSHATSLATQAYHKTLPMGLSPILWTQEPDEVQLRRILYFIHNPKPEIFHLIEQITSLDPMRRALLKTMLHSLLYEISGLTGEQRIFFANQALSRTMESAVIECSTDVIKAIYTSLEDCPTTYPLLTAPPCEGFDVMKANVKAAIRYVRPEALISIKTELQAILFAGQILPPDLLLILTNVAFTKHGFPQAAWSEENPANQILRFLDFATSP